MPSAFSFFGTRIATCVILIELRQALISYQDNDMLLLKNPPFFAPRSVRRPLLVPQVYPGSLYH